MALFSREKTKSFYSELGNSSDVCYYCEKKITDSKANREITIDEAISKSRELRGKLTNVRIAKISQFGRTFSICPNCITEVYKEAGFKESITTKPEELCVKQEVVTEEVEVKKGKSNAKK